MNECLTYIYVYVRKTCVIVGVCDAYVSVHVCMWACVYEEDRVYVKCVCEEDSLYV